jgi:hypothetical protein
MRSIFRLVGSLAVICFPLANASAEEMQWVKNTDPANPNPTCLQLCQDSDKTPYAVRGGNYGQNPYYVCVAQMEGLRPGYQVTNHSAGPVCNVGHGGQEKGSAVAACLCSSQKVAAE